MAILGANSVVLSDSDVSAIANVVTHAGWPTPEYQEKLRRLGYWEAVNRLIQASLEVRANWDRNNHGE